MTDWVNSWNFSLHTHMCQSWLKTNSMRMIYCPFYMCISICTQQRLITQKLLLQVITKSDQSVYCRGHLPTVTLLLYLVTGLLWWGGIVCVYLSWTIIFRLGMNQAKFEVWCSRTQAKKNVWKKHATYILIGTNYFTFDL